MKTRNAVVSDWSGIHAVSKFLGYNELTETVSRTNLEFVLDSDAHYLLVCEQKNQINGWLHLLISHRIASPVFAEIGGLVVDPRHRRKGIGFSLVNHARHWAEQRQLSIRVRCNSQRDDSLQFYQSCGFVPSKLQQVLEIPL
jgi:GNAT superfamily N-acetyltransferase